VLCHPFLTSIEEIRSRTPANGEASHESRRMKAEAAQIRQVERKTTREQEAPVTAS